jgi:CRISPR/Cas system CMR-associated protein Cmr5 small subunit
MRTLAQIRAATALQCYGRQFGGDQGGEVIKKLPARIRNDGLLASLAFCMDKEGDHLDVARMIAEHLAHQEPGGLAPITRSHDVVGLVQELAAGDAALLRRATAESLALLNYMKRFAG